jgi:hypothetical protein
MALSCACAGGVAVPTRPPTPRRLTALTRRVVLPGDLERWETDGGALSGSLYPPPAKGGTAVCTVTPVAGQGPR